jgi:hypothetical protein
MHITKFPSLIQTMGFVELELLCYKQRQKLQSRLLAHMCSTNQRHSLLIKNVKKVCEKDILTS